MTAVLGVSGLGVDYGRRRVVEGVDLAIGRGQTVCLVGESGSGKTTVARAIVGLARASAGTILLDGRDVTADRARRQHDFRRQVQMIFQDPSSSLNPRMTIAQTLLEATTGGRRGNAEARAEVDRLLDTVGLDPALSNRRPSDFSGGQRQRIAIARALAVRPRLIIADEITSALDVSIQGAILNLLRDIQGSTGIAMLFITHNLAVARYVGNWTAVMRAGRVVEAGDADLYEHPQHSYTRDLLAAVQRPPAPKELMS